MVKIVAVIGGGASGMIAAGRAAELGADVHLFERNTDLGNKLLITGKGRCNITNFSDNENIIKNIPGNGKFLYAALNRFSSKDLTRFFNHLGLETKIERGNRVFPKSDSSKDVVNCLEKYMNKNGVTINLGKRVKEIVVDKGFVRGVKLFNNDFFYSDIVILSTGGLSYPKTGSQGDGYSMAQKLGHRVTPLKPSLVPLCTKEDWVREIQGLSLRNVLVSAYYNNKKIVEEFGELLFTHFGVSGPTILTVSRKVVEYLDKGKDKEIKLIINLKPALSWQKLDNRLQRDFMKYSRKSLKNGLIDLLPKKLIPIIIRTSMLYPEKPINQITKDERRALSNAIFNLTLTIIDHRPIEEAIVTMGGISIKEIDPYTLESKLVKGLYFSGEVIDIDGLTGGYNLQSAFSTGYTAGSSCVN